MNKLWNTKALVAAIGIFTVSCVALSAGHTKAKSKAKKPQENVVQSKKKQDRRHSSSSSSSSSDYSWDQWGKDPQHHGFTPAKGDTKLANILASILYDPNAQASFEENDDLLAHYQTALLNHNGEDVYMEFKGGCWEGLENWQSQTWFEKKLSWVDNQLIEQWSFESDWKPVPFSDSTNPGSPGPTWEPVFHSALEGGHVFVPGFSGSLYKISKQTGNVEDQYTPFGYNPNIYLVGPVSVDPDGNVVYNAIELACQNPWDNDVVNSWLVKVWKHGQVQTVSYADITPGAPNGDALCWGYFSNDELPWPPSPDAIPEFTQCGTQRPTINAAVGFAKDGTIYTISRAHFNRNYGYLLAVNPDLTPKWQTSLRDKLNDGCGVAMPPNGQPGGCTLGATKGVDPRTNTMPAGQILDDSTSSPTVAPDGNIYFGAYTRYNWAQGHTMRFDHHGKYLGAFEFGWDETPAVYEHDGSYSLIFKENHYGEVGSYCNDGDICPDNRAVVYPYYPEQYFITSLSPSQFKKNPGRMMDAEWRWQNKNTLSCSSNGNCVSDHPFGFEWCVNAVAVDKNGNVYGNSEDGNVYIISKHGKLVNVRFLNQALGAAYTPISVDAKGRIYCQNFGNLIVLGD